jgi:hypothetical protein
MAPLFKKTAPAAAASDTRPDRDTAAAAPQPAHEQVACLEMGHADKSAGTVHGGRIHLAGFHRALIPAIPPPEAFEASPHRPLVLTSNPFAAAQKVRGARRLAGGAQRAAAACICAPACPPADRKAVGGGWPAVGRTRAAPVAGPAPFCPHCVSLTPLSPAPPPGDDGRGDVHHRAAAEDQRAGHRREL